MPDHRHPRLGLGTHQDDEDPAARIDAADREVRTVDHDFATWNRSLDL